MEFLVDDNKWTHDDQDGSDAVAVDWIERQWSIALALGPPTKRVAAPALAYKMLCIRRLQTLLPIAACYRCCCCCCCCCARLGGHVMRANSSRQTRPSSLVAGMDGTAARLIAVVPSASARQSVRHRSSSIDWCCRAIVRPYGASVSTDIETFN